MIYQKNGKIATKIIELNGFTIVNPTHEQYLEAGYSEYIEPVVEPTTPTDEELKKQYEYRVEELIRERYSLGEEIALSRQRDVKAQEWRDYYDYCEQCKIKAKQI